MPGQTYRPGASWSYGLHAPWSGNTLTMTLLLIILLVVLLVAVLGGRGYYGRRRL
jgi:hypothetical protein